MKRSKKLNFDSPSKISIQPDVGMITKREYMFSEGIIQYILLNVIALCSLITGLSYIDVSMPFFWPFFECILLSAVLCFAPKKAYKAIAVLFCILLLIWLRDDVIYGAFVLIDKYAQLLGTSFEIPGSVVTGVSNDTAVTFFLHAYMILMILVLYYSVFLTKNFIFTFAVSFILPEIGLYNGNAPNYFTAFMLVAAWVCVFAMQLNDYHANRAGKKNIFTRQKKKNIFYMTQRGMKNSAFGQLSIQLCIIMAAALLMGIFGSALSGYERSDKINIMRKNLTYDFSVKTIVNTLRELSGIELPFILSMSDFGAASISGGMAKGDLRKVNDIRFQNKTLMEIAFDSYPGGSIYLRGYAAGKYSDSRWRSEKVSINEAAGKYPLHSLSSPYYFFTNIGLKQNEAKITDLMKSGTLFAPYYSSYLGIDEIKDLTYDNITADKSSYELTFIEGGASFPSMDNAYNYSYSAFDFDTFAYFATTYAQKAQEDESVTPLAVLEQMPLTKLVQKLDIEEEYMEELVSGINIYLNAGLDQPQYYAHIKEYREGGTIAERYPILLDDLNNNDYTNRTVDSDLDTLTKLAYDNYLDQVSSVSDRENECIYTNYAFDHYTQMDINIDEVVLGELDRLYQEQRVKDDQFDMMSGYPSMSGMPFIISYISHVNSAISAIGTYFEQHYTYSLQNPKTPQGRDFIEYFLTDMNTGSCTYFSSAAVEILRHYGIPARYAEGFMIPSSDLRNGLKINGDNKYTIDVKDNYAHAWAEVFLPGVGWLPVDLTLSVSNFYGSNSTVTTSGSETTTTTTTPTEVTTTTESTTTTPEVTTAPQVSESETNSTTGSGGSTVKKAGSSKLSSILMTVGAAALIIAMFVLAYVACISAIRRGLKDSINEENQNKRAVNIYDIVLMYLACIGIRCSENISDKDRCEKLCVMLAEADITGLSEALRAACALAVEAGMSGGVITPEENEKMIALLKKIREICYEKMSRMQRFTAKYIKGLY